MSKLLSLMGMIATLAVAAGLDWALDALKATAQRTFAYEPYFGLIGPANLVLAGTLLMLAWFVLLRAEPSKLVSCIFLFVGLAVTLYLIIPFVLKIPVLTVRSAIFLAPSSHVSHAGAFIAILGIAGFLPRREHS